MSKIIKIKLRLKIGFVAYGNLKMLSMEEGIHLFSIKPYKAGCTQVKMALRSAFPWKLIIKLSVDI